MGRRRRARRDHDPTRGDERDLRRHRQAAARSADQGAGSLRRGITSAPGALRSAAVAKNVGCCGGEERSSVPQHTSVADRPIYDDAGLIYHPNTCSTIALRCSRSSGVLTSLALAAGLGPETIAIYCLPLTSNVIGGAEKPEPTLIFHNWSR